MKIINVIEITNGNILSVESFMIDKILSELDNKYFFTEEEAVQKAEDLFKRLVEENKIPLGDDTIDFYLEEGHIADNNGYELVIFWSGINVNE